MNSRIFVVSDTHFGHVNMLSFSTNEGELLRPFSSIEEVDELMVTNWNNTITEQDDIVYHLGDVFFGDGHKYLSRLKGRKRLILGNHDNGKSEHIQKHFQKVLAWRMFPEYNCVLSHFPLDKSTLFKVEYNLHGHIHKHKSPSPQHINCCVEVQNFTPKLIQSLVGAYELGKYIGDGDHDR